MKLLRRAPQLPILTIAHILIAIGLCFATRAFAATDAQPCANPETRQLDYWLGSWTMGEGTDKSISKVSLSLDKCEFVERWEDGKGHVTEKMFAYSQEEKNWYGMFVDNQGRAHAFLDGKVTSDLAEFHGPSRGASGEPVLNRLKIIRVAPDKLEEVWEKSTDNGAHWTMAYRADYSRANP